MNIIPQYLTACQLCILYQNLLYNINTFNYIYFEPLKEGNINLSFERVKTTSINIHLLNNINLHLPTYRLQKINLIVHLFNYYNPLFATSEDLIIKLLLLNQLIIFTSVLSFYKNMFNLSFVLNHSFLNHYKRI